MTNYVDIKTSWTHAINVLIFNIFTPTYNALNLHTHGADKDTQVDERTQTYTYSGNKKHTHRWRSHVYFVTTQV